MDKTATCNSSRNTIRTDLSLLLECLKFQMKCPDLQKQALLTIHSICEKREDNVDLLREIGGVAFVHKLSKSNIVNSDVKETALFTLGTLAEANVYCKNSLCRKETFVDLATWLMKDGIPLTQKRVCVYLLSVLVASNKSGQTLAQTTGCLDILLDLFRTTFPFSLDANSSLANATHTYQLWASVSSALCGCVNNPQNEEGQRICVVAFPIIKIWLQQITLPRPEIFQSICSFIAMTVANNSYVQESFSASGCLETLTLSLVHLASVADTSLLSCQLSVTIAKTLSACVSDNSALASGLAQFGLVSHLFSLLASPNLDPEHRLSVLLTLGHCTETSEEHQSQLVQCGGLPLIITLLTEDTSEEVRKAAAFILQTCKQATVSLGKPGLIARREEDENAEPVTNMETFRCSARELLRRINLLGKKQTMEAEDEQEDPEPPADRLVIPPLSPASRASVQHVGSIKTICTARGQTGAYKHIEAEADDSTQLYSVRNVITKDNNSELKKMSFNVNTREEKTKNDGGAVCSLCKGTGELMPLQTRQPLEGAREPTTADSPLFKPPAPVSHSVPKERKCTNEQELQDGEVSEMGKITAGEHTHSRCAGCVLPFENVTSRTFASLQSSCPHSCDIHKALQEATEKYRTRHCNLLFRREHQDNTAEPADPSSESVSAAQPQRSQQHWNKVHLTPICKEAGQGRRSLPGHHWKKHNGITLTPLHRGAKRETFSPSNKTGRRAGINRGHHVLADELKTRADRGSTRRKRKDFSLEEVQYLLSGVKTFGFSWNSILWSYPFQPGRTNVDLAKKYRRLMRGKTQGAGCASH